MTHFRKAALALAVASTFTLVGCSNSSSSGSGQESDPTAQTVSGAAVKGVLKSAQVKAYELSDSGDQIREVGSAITNSDGEYELELTDAYAGGLLEIEVTPIPGQTKMVCDASACGTVQKGQDLELPAGFKLNAITSKPSGSATISAPVTAWSSMAANRARVLAADGKSISDSSRQAVAEVNQVAGFDVSRTSAKSVTNIASATSEEQQSAAMNAAVAELIFSGGGDLADALNRFSEALNDGKIDADDSFTAATLSAAVKTVVETNSGFDDTAQDSLTNHTGVLDSKGESFEPSYDPELDVGDDATQADKIAAFQKFVTQFRSWAGSIDETAAALQDETSVVSVALDADVDTIKDVFAQAGVTGDLVSKVIDAFSEQLAGSEGRAALLQALENGTPFTAEQDWTDEDDQNTTGSMSATLVFEETAAGLQATASGNVSQTGGESRDFEIVIGTSLTQDDLSLEYEAEAVLSLLAENNITVSGIVGDGTGFERAVLDLVATLELSDAIASETGVSGDAVLDKFSSIGLAGNVAFANPEAASFVGDMSVKAVNMTGSSFSALDEPFSPESFSLSGDFTATSGRTFNLSASLNNKNAQRFNLFTYLDYSNTTAAFDFEVDRAEVLQFVEYDETAQEFWFNIHTNGWCYDWESDIDEFGERVAYSDWLDSEGLYRNNCNILDSAENAALDQLIMDQLVSAVGNDIATDSQIENVWVRGGSYSELAEVDTDIAFPSLETAENFVNLSFNLAAGVTLVDMPKATAVVTVTRSTFNGAGVLANVSWDGGSYSLQVGTASLNADNPTVNLAFWNPQGFRLEAVGSENADGIQSLTGNVFVNGEDIGDVTLRNGIPVITYPNGDETVFESLF